MGENTLAAATHFHCQRAELFRVSLKLSEDYIEDCDIHTLVSIATNIHVYKIIMH